MLEFMSGPFAFSAAPKGVVINGQPARHWTLRYGNQDLAFDTLPESSTQSDIRSAFCDAIGSWILAAKSRAAATRFDLVTQDGEELASLLLERYPEGCSGCIPDDRFPFWLLTHATPRRGIPVTLDEFARIVSTCSATPNNWIAQLMPDEVLTSVPSAWVAPTSWQIRHIVGEGSLTGITGSQAADLVGVTPANFRKYTARDDAKSRQNMSYAMWHLLLHKLGVQRA